MAQDLSKIHELVTDLFPPPSADDWDRYRLSDEQVSFFHEQGYLSGVRVLDETQADALCEELTAFFDPAHDGADLWYEYNSNESADPSRVLFHALGAWRIGKAFHDLLWHRALTIPASQLLGGPVRFWHDQLFCKPAHHGGVVAWHQDYSYWTRTKPMSHLTCWIGLDPATRENGCLQYVPKSHTWDLLPITGLAGNMEAIKEVLSDEQWAAFRQPVAIELPRGCCSFHHPLLIHGSYENSTDIPRRATVVNMFADGVRSDSDEKLLDPDIVVPKGTKMEGRFFPLLTESPPLGGSSKRDASNSDSLTDGARA
jgi:ectoine hydroxylase-related dioxygenase (phytanoyl-CoA dioxygenase family)